MWEAVSSTKINEIQILLNKFLRIYLKAPWLMRNRQIYNRNTSPSRLKKPQFMNFHTNLKTSYQILAKIKIKFKNSNCKLKYIITLHHIIFHCPALPHKCVVFCSRLFCLGYSFSDIKLLLHSKSPPVISLLFNFISKAGFLI